jgi:hypothetical protein
VVSPDVPDDEPLTQYGHDSDDPPFRNATRSYETDVSLIRGRLTAREAATLIRRQGERYQVTGFATRRRDGSAPPALWFAARRRRRIPGHVSAELQSPGDVWDNSARSRFDECFEE